MPTFARSMVSELRATLRTRIRRFLAGELRISRTTAPDATTEVGDLTATCHWAWPAEHPALGGWNDLFSRVPLATTFHCHTWQQLGVSPTCPAGTLRVLRVSRGDRLLAILPLQRTPTGFLDSAGHTISDYLDPLIDPAEHEPAWRALLSLLRAQWDPDTRGLTLHNLPPESPSRDVLKRIAPDEGFICEESQTSNAARLALPTTWDDYLASLDPHERKELKRKLRKAESGAGATLRITDATNYHPDHLADALRLVEAAGGEKADWFRRAVRPVLERVGEPLTREGRMRLLTLMLHDHPAASLIEFPSAAGPLMYNGGFDPAQREWSPGAVTFALAIKDAIQRGATIFDFLRGREDYKYKLGAKDAPVYRIALRR